MKELVVISPLRDWTCRECEGSGDLLVMEEAGPLCLACAELDHLVFLGSGDATLTRLSLIHARTAAGRAAGRNPLRFGALPQLQEDVPARSSTSFSFRATIVLLCAEGMRWTHRRASTLRKPRGNSTSGSAANSRPRVGER